MYILKLSLIPLGAVTTEPIYVMQTPRKSRMRPARADSYGETKKKEKGKGTTAPSVILLNTVCVVCGCYCEFRLQVFTRKKTRCSHSRSFATDLTCMIYGVFANWSTRNETFEQDFLVGLSLLNGEFSHLQNQSATVCHGIMLLHKHGR